MNGTVLKWDRKVGYGWAVPDDLTADVFLHHSQLPPNRKYLNEDDRISYEMGTHDGKLCAINIRFIGHVIGRQVGEKAARP